MYGELAPAQPWPSPCCSPPSSPPHLPPTPPPHLFIPLPPGSRKVRLARHRHTPGGVLCQLEKKEEWEGRAGPQGHQVWTRIFPQQPSPAAAQLRGPHCCPNPQSPLKFHAGSLRAMWLFPARPHPHPESRPHLVKGEHMARHPLISQDPGCSCSTTGLCFSI